MLPNNDHALDLSLTIRYPNGFFVLLHLLIKHDLKFGNKIRDIKKTEWVVNQEVFNPIKKLMSRKRVQRTGELLVTNFKTILR